jgi:DNA-binding transcriptional LysR family regulator
MLEDFRLKVFMTVAQEGSFTKAAARLNISQPAVSQHISELEKNTGVKLFERLRGEVVLTDQGRVFQIHAKRILDAYVSATALFAQTEAATITIKASEELYLYIYKALEQYMNIHPEIKILRSEDCTADLTLALAPAPTLALVQKNMGGISATHNIISSLYLCCQPSETFAQSELFESLRSFLADYFTI